MHVLVSEAGSLLYLMYFFTVLLFFQFQDILQIRRTLGDEEFEKHLRISAQS